MIVDCNGNTIKSEIDQIVIDDNRYFVKTTDGWYYADGYDEMLVDVDSLDNMIKALGLIKKLEGESE